MKGNVHLAAVGVILTLGFLVPETATAEPVSERTFQMLEQAQRRSLKPLEKILEKAPADARAGIQEAMIAVTKGFETAFSYLSGSASASRTSGKRPEGILPEEMAGWERAATAIEKGTEKALQVLADLPDAVRERDLPDLKKSMKRIQAGRDRALATLDFASQNREPGGSHLPDATSPTSRRDSGSRRPSRPDRP